MPNNTPATTSDGPGQASTMTPSATPRMPIRSSNCHVLRASWCSGPSKTVFSLVVIPKKIVRGRCEEIVSSDSVKHFAQGSRTMPVRDHCGRRLVQHQVRGLFVAGRQRSAATWLVDDVAALT